MTFDTSLVAMKLEKNALGRLEFLAQGGQATIYRLPDLTLPDTDFPLVCKMYRPRWLPIPWVGLARLAMVRATETPKRRSWLDRYFTWPLRVVVEGGQGVGCVMPLLDDRFFHKFQSLTGLVSVRPLEIQHLFVPKQRNVQVGLPHASHIQRLSLCFEASRALDVLHSTGLIYGDVSSRNLLFSLRPNPTVVFVEGDALRRSGSSAVVPQVETPDWPAPEEAKAQSEPTDRYKLGLMILRILTPGPGTSTNRDPLSIGDRLDPEGRNLLRQALGTSRDHRPTAGEWVRYFRGVLTGAGSAPTSSPEPRSNPGGAADDPSARIPRVPSAVTHGGAWVKKDGKWGPEA